MSDTAVTVDQIDHVELTVPDRYEAAEWYEEVLGLEVVPEYESWAERKTYPLMVSSDDGDTMLALFRGNPETTGRSNGLRLVAFRTDADGFLAFLEKLADRSDVEVSGRSDVIDFGLAYSVFFHDPWGYRFEITTYDYDAVSEAL